MIYFKFHTKGFTLLEALAALVVSTIVLLGVLNSSLMALSASAKTEQTFDAEDLADTSMSILQQDYDTLGIPYTNTTIEKRSSAEYSVKEEILTCAETPYCAEAVATISWKQGRLSRSTVRRQIFVIEEQTGGSLP